MPGRRAAWIGGLTVVLVTIVVVAAIRFAGPPIYDGDGWYHIKYATILYHDGISRTFPWFQESFLKDRFTDLNILYHLLLIPFTFGDLPTGARIASILFAATTMGLFFATVAMRQWGERWETGVPTNPVLADERDRKPILPVTLRGHDDRILSHMDLCWIDESEAALASRSDDTAIVRKIGSA